jgi:hypothetical protein
VDSRDALAAEHIETGPIQRRAIGDDPDVGRFDAVPRPAMELGGKIPALLPSSLRTQFQE